jgi:hypothetical protein
LQLKKEKPPTLISRMTNQTESMLMQIPTDMREVIRRYFNKFDDFIAAREYQSDTFVREVYYATTLDKTTSLTLKEMESCIHEINRTKLRLISYEIDECMMLSSSVSLLGITRLFSDQSRNRVLYFLEKIDGSWKFHHIARSIRGSILDKFHISHQTCFVIGSQEWSMLFLTSDNALGIDFLLGEQVHVEGYLEITDLAPTDWIHRIVRLNRLH